jgi:hypothetical protein
MKNEVLQEMIFLNQEISTILSKLYILEEEASYYKLKNNYLYKDLKLSIKEKYDSLLRIQLNSMELPYDKTEESLMFYRNMIFSVSDRKNESETASFNYYTVIFEKLYSSIAPKNFQTANIEFITEHLIENNFTTIIDLFVVNKDSNFKKPAFNERMGNFLKKKDFNISYTFFEFSADFKTDFRKIEEVVCQIDSLICRNEKIYLHSENDDAIIGFILCCYLVKKKIVNTNDVIHFVNYLRSLSKYNDEEFVLDQEQINFICQYAKSL